MLYLIDKYIARFSYRQIPELLRFEECEKYLHEMTLSEVNKIVAGWKPVLPDTADYTRRKIAQYLEWLIQEHNIPIAFDLSKVNFPIKEASSEYAIYSTNDIKKYYNTLYSAIERKAAATGTNASIQMFRMTHAAGILAFYGMTDKEILDLDLSDVQPDGIIGHDLPLTQDDINVLLEYKNMQKYDNDQSLRGEKYIRNRAGQVADSYFLNRPLSKVDIEEKYLYLRSLLKTSQLSLFGKFNQVYNEEIKRGDKIEPNGILQKWFKDIFQVSPNWLTKRRKEYIAYRELRDKDKNVANNDIINRLNAIDSQIAKLNQEAEELRKQLL